MALSDTALRAALSDGTWAAFREGQPIGADDLTINPNSVNVSLGAQILEIVVRGGHIEGHSIDLHDPNSFAVNEYLCDGGGFVLKPNRLYLAAVRESFACSAPLWVPQRFRFHDEQRNVWHTASEEVETYFYPCVDGRSTAARVGLSVHQTAGFGDYGFGSPFTLELTVIHAVRVREGNEIAQVSFRPLCGQPTARYEGAYTAQRGPRVASLGRERFQR